MYIAIDAGATNIRIAFAKKANVPKFFAVEKFKLSHNLNSDLKRIFKIIDKHSSGKVIKAIGVGLPGTPDDKRTKLTRTTNLKEWENIKFSQIFKKRYSCPVWMDNDVVVAAFSELYDKKSEDKNYIYLTWGTGIGGAKVQKEKDRFVVKELNYSHYFGEFEAKCGGKNIKKRFRKLAKELDKKGWNNLSNDFEENIVNLSKTLKIKNFILSGGIAFDQKNKLKITINKLKEKSITLRFSKFGVDAGIYGALAFINYKIV